MRQPSWMWFLGFGRNACTSSGNTAPSRMKKTGMLLPTKSQFPYSPHAPPVHTAATSLDLQRMQVLHARATSRGLPHPVGRKPQPQPLYACKPRDVSQTLQLSGNAPRTAVLDGPISLACTGGQAQATRQLGTSLLEHGDTGHHSHCRCYGANVKLIGKPQPQWLMSETYAADQSVVNNIYNPRQIRGANEGHGVTGRRLQSQGGGHSAGGHARDRWKPRDVTVASKGQILKAINVTNDHVPNPKLC